MPLSAGCSSFIIQRSDAVSTAVLGIEQNSKQLSTQSMTQHSAIYHRSTFHVAAPSSDVYLDRGFLHLIHSLSLHTKIFSFTRSSRLSWQSDACSGCAWILCLEERKVLWGATKTHTPLKLQTRESYVKSGSSLRSHDSYPTFGNLNSNSFSNPVKYHCLLS
jgi:hypothetical protein